MVVIMGHGGLNARSMDYVDVLNTFADVEMQIAGFYERLAEMFDDDLEVSEFWLHLSGEEIEHADALKDAAETLAETQPATNVQQPLIEPTTLRKLYRDINICEGLMTRHDRSIDAAFQCALFIESSELNDIYCWLLDRMPLHWTETLDSLSDGSGQHIVGLCEAVERFAQDEQLVERAAALRRQQEEYGVPLHLIALERNQTRIFYTSLDESES